MGLFDKIAKNLAGELGNIVKNATDTALGNNPQPAAQTAIPAQSPPTQTPVSGDNKAYFAEILASEFGEYQVRRDVPLSEFGGEGRPYDFGLFKDGKLAAVIVLVGKNGVRNHPYWNSEKLAASMSVPFINFYTHMPNERNFVIDRIKRFI